MKDLAGKIVTDWYVRILNVQINSRWYLMNVIIFRLTLIFHQLTLVYHILLQQQQKCSLFFRNKKVRVNLVSAPPAGRAAAARKEMLESASGRMWALLGVWLFVVFSWFLYGLCRMHQAITSAQIAHWFTVGVQFANITITDEVKKEAEAPATADR